MVYDEIAVLRNRVCVLPSYDSQGFLNKYPYMLILESQEEQQRLAEEDS
jgi:hypothetical protein